MHTINNIYPYGYETNHVSPLISMKSDSFLVSHAKMTFPGLWLYTIIKASKCYRLFIWVVLWNICYLKPHIVSGFKMSTLIIVIL